MASAMDFPLKLISFVSPSEENAKDTVVSTSRFQSGLSASEARCFYNSVISSPSSQVSKPQNPKKQTRSSKKIKSSPPHFAEDAIFRLAQEGNLVEIKKFVDSGYPINQQDAYGWTPLMCAACAGHEETVSYLIEQGSNIEAKCKQNMTAIDIAMKSEHYSIVQLLQQNGIDSKEPTFSIDIKQEKDIQNFCDICKVIYRTTRLLHERSIAHLFNTKKSKISTFYHIPESNKGFQLMLKSGWDKESGLGLNADGRKFPIKTVLKKDRTCIGKNKEVSKVTHFNANDKSAVEGIHRESVKAVREKTLKKWQRKKLDQISRQQEINFRRQFNSDF